MLCACLCCVCVCCQWSAVTVQSFSLWLLPSALVERGEKYLSDASRSEDSNKTKPKCALQCIHISALIDAIDAMLWGAGAAPLACVVHVKCTCTLNTK